MLQIGAQARGEHDKNDADFGKDFKPALDFFRKEHIFKRLAGNELQKPDQQSRDQHADYGGQPDPLRTQP